MWSQAAAIGLMAVVVASAAVAQRPEEASEIQIIGISVPALDLFDGPNGKKIDTVPRDRVALPVAVLRVEPNKRLKVRLQDGREAWVEGRYVRTNAVQKEFGCEPSPTQDATTLSTRGLGGGCN